MQIHDKVAQDLHGILAKKFTKLTLADSQAISTVEPAKGRIFTLEYGGSGKSYGSVTANIVDPNSLVIYYNTNIAESMSYDDKKEWYNFLKELRYFAKRNLMNFDVRNIGKQQLDKTDYAYIKQNDNSYDQSEVKFESKLTGTLKTSYQTFGESVRLIIKHTTPVDEDKRGARTRHIHHLYVEDSSGERIRLPFKSLIAGRAVAQHYNNGGLITDDIGQHIHELTQEAYDLQKFIKAFRRADNFANIDEAKKIIEQARSRYQGVRETLKTIARPKGYKNYTEQYKPITDDIEQADLDNIRSNLMRIEKDNIVDTVLPSLARGMNKMKVEENRIQAAMDMAKDPSAKLELFPDPVDDQEIKDYVKMIKNNVIKNKKTSENPSDGIVNKILVSLARRSVDDEVAMGIDQMAEKALDDENPNMAAKKAAYQLASKYLKGNVDIVEPKAKKKLKAEDEQFEDYMNNLSEGTWTIPDSAESVSELESVMADALPLGAEGENATGTMYGIIGDDELFDDLGDAGDKDPNADARPIISDWISRNIQNYDIDADLVSKIMAINNKFKGTPQPTSEGAVKRALEKDAVEMSKEEFMKKHGGTDAKDKEAEEFYNAYNGVDEAEVEEGNKFIDARRDAIKAGKTEFEVDGKKYKVTGDTSDEKKQAKTEGYRSDATQEEIDEIADAIKWRLTASPVTMDKVLKNHTMQELMNAIEDVAEFNAPLEEIGSSDMAIMVREVMQNLGIKEEISMPIEEEKDKVQMAVDAFKHGKIDRKEMANMYEVFKDFNDEDLDFIIKHGDLPEAEIKESYHKDMMQDVEEGMSKEEFAKKYPASADKYDEIKKEIQDQYDESKAVSEELDRDNVKLDDVKTGLEKLFNYLKKDQKDYYDEEAQEKAELKAKGMSDIEIEKELADGDYDYQYTNIGDLEDKIDALTRLMNKPDADGNDIVGTMYDGPQDTSPREDFMGEIKYAIKKYHPEVYSKLFQYDVGESKYKDKYDADDVGKRRDEDEVGQHLIDEILYLSGLK